MQTSLLTMILRLWYLMLVFFRCRAIFIYRRRAHKKKRCNSIRISSSRMSSFELKCKVDCVKTNEIVSKHSSKLNHTASNGIWKLCWHFCFFFLAFFPRLFHFHCHFIPLLLFFLSFISFYAFNKCFKQVAFIEIDRLLLVRTIYFQFIYLFLHLFGLNTF